MVYRRATELALIAALIVGLSGGESALAAEIGRIKTVKGTAFVERGGQRLALIENASLEENDRLETAPDSALGAVLADGTTLSMGGKSRLTLDKFVFDPAHDQMGMAAQLLEGTFAFTSGRIAKLDPNKVQISTPLMSIGIRGTSFLVEVAKQ